MIVDELIAKLKRLPPDTPVLVEGYETGFDEIVDVAIQEVVKVEQPADWDGEFNSASEAPRIEQASKAGLGGLLKNVKLDQRFTDEESRDSAIYANGEACEQPERVPAVLLIGRRGHRRQT